VAVFLHRRSTARRGDQDRVEPFALDLGHPGIDVAPGEGLRVRLPAHVVDQSAAAAFPPDGDDLDTVPGEQPFGGLVDGRPQHALGAAAENRHAAAAGSLRRGRRAWVPTGQPRGRERHHRVHALALGQPGERVAEHAPGYAGAQEGEAEPARIGQNGGQDRAQQPLGGRAAIGLLDMRTGMIDEMHVVHARRAGRHAGEAGEAAVDVPNLGLGGGATGFEHVLDEVDAPARAVALVAVEQVGRAGRGTEAAMHAAPDDLFGGLDGRIGELGRGEMGAHRFNGPNTCGRG
jgi:hypothetical protein